jgi:hypothetical protein
MVALERVVGRSSSSSPSMGLMTSMPSPTRRAVALVPARSGLGAGAQRPWRRRAVALVPARSGLDAGRRSVVLSAEEGVGSCMRACVGGGVDGADLRPHLGDAALGGLGAGRRSVVLPWTGDSASSSLLLIGNTNEFNASHVSTDNLRTKFRQKYKTFQLTSRRFLDFIPTRSFSSFRLMCFEVAPARSSFPLHQDSATENPRKKLPQQQQQTGGGSTVS